jgi:hypothetical protein
MADTLATVRQSVLNWLRGDYVLATDVPLVNEAINDALETIWNKMVITQYERMFGANSPISFNAPAGSQRVTLVSIADPTIAPVVAAVAGGTLGARNYQIAYTYVTESGSETNPSPYSPLAVGANQLAKVTSPAYEGGFKVFGYNVYSTGVSNDLDQVALQNQNPVPIGVPFTEPVAGFQDLGAVIPGPPQQQWDQPPPLSNTTGDNIAWIEHLEVITSDTLMRAWNQVSLDSEVMRRMARTLSTASEYQHYVWDLINGNVIEFRPPLGLSFSPRYWPVVKVRRLAYDQAEMPYININGVREFIVAKAVAALKLGVEEYLASQAWDQKAGAKALEVQIALLAENWKKDSRIVPHLW